LLRSSVRRSAPNRDFTGVTLNPDVHGRDALEVVRQQQSGAEVEKRYDALGMSKSPARSLDISGETRFIAA
jgi:hypothetical protein